MGIRCLLCVSFNYHQKWARFGFTWIEWQPSHGLGGRHPWNMHATVGEAHGERIRHWFETKKAGWYAVLADPKMPAMSTALDQAHNAMDRKLFAMKGFHHPGGSQAAFLTGLAHLYNLIPYQRRALHAGKCGVEVEGGCVPTSDWMLNLQILTSGGYRPAGMGATT